VKQGKKATNHIEDTSSVVGNVTAFLQFPFPPADLSLPRPLNRVLLSLPSRSPNGLSSVVTFSDCSDEDEEERDEESEHRR
jgi:hypothetical protein